MLGLKVCDTTIHSWVEKLLKIQLSIEFYFVIILYGGGGVGGRGGDKYLYNTDSVLVITSKPEPT